MSSAALTRALPSLPVNASVTTAQLFANRQVPSVPTVIGILGSGRLEQRKFTVRASGSATTGTTSNLTATLYIAAAIPATPFTAGSWAVLGASTAHSLVSLTAPWMIEAQLEFESIGGTMQGIYNALINNAVDAAAAISNRLTGLNGTSNTITQEPGGAVVVAAEPVFVIGVGLTFSVANAGNVGTLGDFCLDG